MGLQEGWAPGSKSSTGGGDSSHLLVATPGLGWAGAALWEQLGRTGLMDSPGGAVKQRQRLPCWPGAASINGSTCSS